MICFDPITLDDLRELAWSYMERADDLASARAVRDKAASLIESVENGHSLTLAEAEGHFAYQLNDAPA